MNSHERVLTRYLKAVRALQAVGVATGLPVPDVDQSPGLCGPAALKAVLGFYGRVVTEDELAHLSGANPEDGVGPEGLVRAAQAMGFHAAVRESASIQDLQSWLDHGIPVIVDWFSQDEGHYSVVKAIQGGSIFMMDPEKNTETETPLDSFERTWFDFEEGDTRKHQGLVQRQMIVVWP